MAPSEVSGWIDAVSNAGFVGLLIALVLALAFGYLYTRKAVEIMHLGLVQGQHEKDAAHKERVDALIEQRDHYKQQSDEAQCLIGKLAENEMLLLRKITPVLTKFFGEATIDRGET